MEVAEQNTGKRKRKKGLQGIFRRFLLEVVGLGLGILLVWVLSFIFCERLGLVLPANYEERLLEETREEIENAERVEEDLIPPGRNYGVFQEDGTYLYGNMNERLQKTVWKLYQTEEHFVKPYMYIKSFQRKEGICIVTYLLKVQLKSDFLRTWFPNIREIALYAPVLLFFLGIWYLTRRFSRSLKGELQHLQDIAKQVEEHNLEFECPESGIREIEEVIASFLEMRDALRVSMKRQWELEEKRNRQIGALAHDLKTPLTVIRGNSQLIEEADSLNEAALYNRYLSKEVDTLENYLEILQDMLCSGDGLKIRNEIFSVHELTGEFRMRVQALAAYRNQQIEFEAENLPDFMKSDRNLLIRAWENLVLNAAEYTPEGGTIRIRLEMKEKKLLFAVEDEGPGFTGEGLIHAAEQFYQGDKSRNSKKHYGMGLYIADSFAKMQGGKLILANSERTGGGLATMVIIPDIPEKQAI